MGLAVFAGAHDGPWTVGWDAIVAIGTLAAVVVAVLIALLPLIRERRRRPRLSLTHAEPHDIVRERSASEDVARFRLRIKAAEGKRTAENVEVFVESVSETVADGIRALLPAGGQPLRVSHSDRTAQAVPSGASRFVDLVELRRRSGSRTSAALLLAGTPVELHLGKPCRLEINVAGANFDSSALRCEVSWTAEFDSHGFPQEALEVVVLAPK